MMAEPANTEPMRCHFAFLKLANIDTLHGVTSSCGLPMNFSVCILARFYSTTGHFKPISQGHANPYKRCCLRLRHPI